MSGRFVSLAVQWCRSFKKKIAIFINETEITKKISHKKLEIEAWLKHRSNFWLFLKLQTLNIHHKFGENLHYTTAFQFWENTEYRENLSVEICDESSV